MTCITAAAEFNHWRQAMYLTKRETAIRLGISVRQVAYYATGEKPIPRYISLACEALLVQRALAEALITSPAIGATLALWAARIPADGLPSAYPEITRA